MTRHGIENGDQTNNISAPSKGLSDVIGRLGYLIKEETAALQINDVEKLEVFSEQKNRILLEFNRAMIAAGNVSGIPGLFKDIENLRTHLAENKSMLKRQLTAVKDYSVFLEDEARRHETDGTYSQSIGRYGAKI